MRHGADLSNALKNRRKHRGHDGPAFPRHGRAQAKQGVDYMTIHVGVKLRALHLTVIPVTGNRAAWIVDRQNGWMVHNKQ